MSEYDILLVNRKDKLHQNRLSEKSSQLLFNWTNSMKTLRMQLYLPVYSSQGMANEQFTITYPVMLRIQYEFIKGGVRLCNIKTEYFKLFIFLIDEISWRFYNINKLLVRKHLKKSNAACFYTPIVLKLLIVVQMWKQHE